MGTDIVKHEVVDIQALISQGLEKGAGIDVMERLFAMAKEMKAMSAKELFFEALAKFQKEMKTIIKTKEVASAKTGKLIYTYAPLDVIIEQVKEPLDNNGFSYTLKTEQKDGQMTVFCEAHHTAGHTETTSMTVPIGSEYMTAQQQVGAALTFAKRYAFCDAFGIMTGDEDTDAVDTGSGVKETKPTEKPVEAKQPPQQDADLTLDLRPILGEAKAAEFVCGEIKSFDKKSVKAPTVFEVSDGANEASIRIWDKKIGNETLPISNTLELKTGMFVRFLKLTMKLWEQKDGKKIKQWYAEAIEVLIEAGK